MCRHRNFYISIEKWSLIMDVMTHMYTIISFIIKSDEIVNYYQSILCYLLIWPERRWGYKNTDYNWLSLKFRHSTKFAQMSFSEASVRTEKWRRAEERKTGGVFVSYVCYHIIQFVYNFKNCKYLNCEISKRNVELLKWR